LVILANMGTGQKKTFWEKSSTKQRRHTNAKDKIKKRALWVAGWDKKKLQEKPCAREKEGGKPQKQIGGEKRKVLFNIIKVGPATLQEGGKE